MDESVLAELRNGAEYDCYADFEAAVSEYSENKCMLFVRSNSRTVENANKKIVSTAKSYSSKCVYTFIELTCKHYLWQTTSGWQGTPSKPKVHVTSALTDKIT